MQLTRCENVAHVVVADAGQGIGCSMRRAFPHLADDLSALQKAVLPGITSGLGEGNGLAGLNNIARLAAGEVTLMSGQAWGMMRYGKRAYETWDKPLRGVHFPGTAVSFSIPLDVHFDLKEALRFQHPEWEMFDVLEAPGRAFADKVRELARSRRRREVSCRLLWPARGGLQLRG